MTERPQSPEVRRVPSSFYRTMVRSGRAPVNGFQMYYEVHGTTKGRPLVSIHGTWESEQDFRAAFPALVGFLSRIDFLTLQDGPTRSGAAVRSDSPLTSIKVAPVTGMR